MDQRFRSLATPFREFHSAQQQQRQRPERPHRRGQRRMDRHGGPNRRDVLRQTCRETVDVATAALRQLGRLQAAQRAHRYTLDTLPPLHPSDCPCFPRPATVEVVNEDTLNAAIALSARRAAADAVAATAATAIDPSPGPDGQGSGRRPDVAILIFANRHSPGGGWRNGAVAQEEAVCYRSSLALSIEGADYPLARDEALFSPYVLVIREDMARGGHHLMDVEPEDLPVVSAMTVAAITKPEVTTVPHSSAERAWWQQQQQQQQQQHSRQGKQIFALGRDRHYTKEKMRLALRMAASHGRRSLVLGAFGCGVFANPPEDVALCWLEVLRDDEFRAAGNWWRDVCFAVYDPHGEGNYEIFRRVLQGQQV